MDREITILGAGTYCAAMIDLAFECGYQVSGIYDDNPEKIGSQILGINVVGSISQILNSDYAGGKFLIAIGNNMVRRKIAEEIRSQKGQTPSLIHPTAVISKFSNIGLGVYIQPHVVVWTCVTIEDDCIISPNVVIAHHSTLRKGCLVSTSSAIGANIEIRQEAFLGMSCNITTGVEYVGENALVGAGTVVIKNIESNTVVAGVPAKVIRKKGSAYVE